MDNKAEVVNLQVVGKIFGRNRLPLLERSRNFLPGRFRRQEYQVVLQDLGEQREVSAPDPLEVEPNSQDSVGHHTPGQGGSQGGGAQGFKEVGGGVQARDHSPDPSRPRPQPAQQQRGSAS